MPKYQPNSRFSDCWSSVGNITFYHRDGNCYYRTKPVCKFKGTEDQMKTAEVHQRALESWRTLTHEVQLQWNEYAREVPPHRPPFDGSGHITGHNLFVSAYHGFAQLGDEHIPEPAPFVPFPPFAVNIMDVTVIGNEMTIRFALDLDDSEERYRHLAKIQLTKPGGGRNPGAMRNHLAEKNAEDKIAVVKIPDYTSVSGLDSDSCQLHTRCILLDTKTGYRSQWQQQSAILQIVSE